MKKFYLFLGFIFFMLGCKVIPQGFTLVKGDIEKKENEKCNELYNEIKEKWARNDSIHCFYHNQKLMEKIVDNKTCFIGLDTSEVIGLFGKPNRNGYHITYNLSDECQDEADSIISSYKFCFYYNKKGEITSHKYSKNAILE